MSDKPAKLLYYIKVKFPDQMTMVGGDDQLYYDNVCRQMIREAKPDGFEVDLETRKSWPVDYEWNTLVQLYCTDPKMAINFYSGLSERKSKQLNKVVAKVKLLNELVGNL